MPDTDPPEGTEVQAAAQVLAGLAGDERQLLERIAAQFSTAWPEAVSVRRKGLFNSGRVVAVTIKLGERHFELAADAGQVRAVEAEAHGGVAIAHLEVSVDRWVTDLAAALGAAAERSESARRTLLSLLS